MKKIVAILITMATFYGCSDEVQFNTPALQGNKNYELWRASYYGAVLKENNQLTIKAGDNSEKMTITLSSMEEGAFNLSNKSASSIDFRDADNVLYSTRNITEQENSLSFGNGKVTITKIEDNTISGDFNFLAFTEDGLNSIGFNDGVIYKVPVKLDKKLTE